ncbi:MAG: ribosome biogenesis GTPase Der [Actinomycetes bacterium]|jgi:GTP-binding protein|nr:ribosome biogenesis GTPase Der [Actinomycetes bacterium]
MAQLPLVAVVGRPNVGKSSLVNRLSGAKDAIVHAQRGVTRDRSYHRAEWNGRAFNLVDTGGVETARDDAFQTGIRTQAMIAASQADVIVMVVDGTSGLAADDDELAGLIKRTKKPLFLVVNKVDDPDNESAGWEFWQLGLGEPWIVSALHGTGTGDLLDALVDALPADVGEDDLETDYIKVALIGRPNAGKSSLVNRLAGTERSIVSAVAGTTRDAIDTTFTADGRDWLLIDTAGLRRKALIDSDVEYYGFVRAMRAMDRCDVALLVVDSEIGLTDQDQRVANYAIERGCALVVLLNKWDLMRTGAVDARDADPEAAERARQLLLDRVADRLDFASFAPVLRISALTGRGADKILSTAATAYDHHRAELSTAALNRLLTELRDFGHTVSRGARRLRVNYVTQTGTAPPQLTFFCNHPDLADDNFRRYLENRVRERFDLTGTPLRLRFRKKD